MQEQAAKERAEFIKQQKEETERLQKETSDYFKSEYELEQKTIQEEYDKRLDLFKKYGGNIKELNDWLIAELERAEEEENTRKEEKQKEIREKQQKELEEASRKAIEQSKESIKEQAELYNKSIEEQEEKIREMELAALEAEKNGADNLREIQENLEKQRQLYEDEKQKINDLEIERLTELLNSEKLTEEARADIQAQLTQMVKSETEKRHKIEIDAAKKSLAEQKETEKLKAKIKEDNYNNLKDIASKTVEVLGKETAEGKAVAIAAATIDTLKAAVNVFSSTPGGLVAKSIASAAALAQGYATIKQIGSTKVPGGDSSSDAGATSTIENAQTYIPAVEETYTGQMQAEAESNKLASSEFTQLNKVYVTETDIFTVQNKVRMVEEEASF